VEQVLAAVRVGPGKTEIREFGLKDVDLAIKSSAATACRM